MHPHAVNNLDLSDEQSYDEEATRRLKFVSADCFKTQRTCEMKVEKERWLLECFPDHFKIKKMCNKAVRTWTGSLRHVPDYLKAQGMCETVVRRGPCMRKFVPTILKHRDV